MEFLSKKMHRRSVKAATVSLAIWLLLQTSTLYFLHHHPESASCEENGVSCLMSFPGAAHRGSFSTLTSIGPPTGGSHDRSSRTAVCVICFFNQNYYGFTSSYVVPDGSRTPAIGPRPQQEDFLLPDDLLTATSPRAPPALCL